MREREPWNADAPAPALHGAVSFPRRAAPPPPPPPPRRPGRPQNLNFQVAPSRCRPGDSDPGSPGRRPRQACPDGRDAPSLSLRAAAAARASWTWRCQSAAPDCASSSRVCRRAGGGGGKGGGGRGASREGAGAHTRDAGRARAYGERRNISQTGGGPDRRRKAAGKVSRAPPPPLTPDQISIRSPRIS